jgi:transcriptional regulator with XRE-family HTH domain
MNDRESIRPSFTPVDLRGLGSRVARFRLQRGWKQVELSRRTAIPPTRLSRLEKGRTAPNLDELVRLGAVLGVDLGQIVFGGEARTGPTQRLAAEVERLGAPDELEVIRRLLHYLIAGYQAERSSHAHA